MALALYRKYRPRTFAEVIGQEHVTEPLSQALRSGRLHHAYLFSGPRGCGKTSSARILARSLNCEQGPTPEPCGQCASCRSLSNDGPGSIDVIEIDAASHGGVDDARELREKAFFAPASSRFKIYVIDEAHMVSSAGFNALLKLVEEPPDYVKFIFATTEPEKVLGTIKSRTHHYPFRLIPPATLRPYLEQLCAAEDVKVDPLVFPLVVRAGGGSARDTLSVLDQLIAGAGADGVSYARAVSLLGVTDVALIDEMCDALAAADGAAAYETIDRVAEAGHDPRRFASDLLERLRDLIVMQQVPDAVSKGLIDAPADQIDRMNGQAGRLGPATLSRAADIVHNGLVEMRGTTAPRLLLELVTARMLLPGAEDSTGALLQRLERMERRLAFQDHEVRAAPGADAGHAPATPPSPAQPPAGSGPAAYPPDLPTPQRTFQSSTVSAAAQPAPVTRPDPAPATRPDPAPATRPDPAPATRPDPATGEPGADPSAATAGVMPDSPADLRPEPAQSADGSGGLSAGAIREAWPEVVATVGRRSKKTAALAQGATVRDIDGNSLVLTFRFPAHARMLAGQPEPVIEALYEILGVRWQLRCEVAGEGGAITPGGPQSHPAPAQQPGPPAAQQGAPTTQQPAGGPAQQPGRAPAQPAGSPRGVAPDNGTGPGSGDSHDSGGGYPTPSAFAAGRLAGLGGSPSAGGASVAQTPSGTSATTVATVDDWPEPARPGGSAPAVAPQAAEQAAAGRHSAPNRPASSPALDTRPGAGDSTAAQSSQPGRPPAQPGSGLAAARAAAAGAGRGAPPANGAWSDGSPAEEPPYDPEYDGPIPAMGPGTAGATSAKARSYEGFDPGDEPTDDVIDEKTSRQSSEQQAVQLLRDAFGAEKIGES